MPSLMIFLTEPYVQWRYSLYQKKEQTKRNVIKKFPTKLFSLAHYISLTSKAMEEEGQ